MLDNQSDKVILVCYPAGAGGKFLINSLGLSDNCIFSHSELAQQQLQGQFDFQSKVDYLMSRLDLCQEQNYWDDLGLGCAELLGFPAHNGAFSNPDLRHITEKYIDPVMDGIFRSRHYFFLTCHDTFSIRQYKAFWPNAKLIIFKNFSQFNKRRLLGNRPSHRLISEIWDSDIEIISQQINDPFYWDCFWYDNEHAVLENLDRCCDWLNIKHIDHQAIKMYRKRWLEVVMITDKDQENYATNPVI
jgi:hypothetical protein